MARKRYQNGCVYRRGNVWVARWREDVVTTEGKDKRFLRSETYSLKDYPTKKMVQRELQRKLAEINARNYRAKPQTKFEVFALKWQSTVLPESMKPSSQLAVRSQIRFHFIPTLGSIALSNFTPEVLDTFISGLKVSTKTKKNLVATLRIMWAKAKAWKLVDHDPFAGLKLPKRTKPDARFFTANEMLRIIEAAPEPYKTFYWLAAETGMRAGELTGLRWEDVDDVKGIVHVRQSLWRGQVTSPKSAAGIRHFAISGTLAARLGTQRRERGHLQFVFVSSTGNGWDSNMLVKRKLHPLLCRLGIERAGLHAFRHGNATVMDQVDVPTRVRQSRLGHSDIATTMGYTHAVASDDQKAAAEVQRMIFKPQIIWQIAEGNA